MFIYGATWVIFEIVVSASSLMTYCVPVGFLSVRALPFVVPGQWTACVYGALFSGDRNLQLL